MVVCACSLYVTKSENIDFAFKSVFRINSERTANLAVWLKYNDTPH